jgi:GT2 family glycosyltransferase
VIVVDNNSGDGSVEQLSATIEAQGWERWVTLLPQGSNSGFAAGNNEAIRHLLSQDVPPDYVMLLNPDTVAHAGAVECLVHFLAEHPNVGIVGAQLENGNHILESSARRYPSVLSEMDNGARFGLLSSLLKKWQVALPVVDYAHRCDWVSGAAMMIRREVFEQVGLMDEGFFLYFEELDFCQRAGIAGWQVWLEPASLITHLEGQATGIQHTRNRRGKYWYDSRRQYFIKHHGVLRLMLADILWGLGRCSLLFRQLLQLGGDTTSDPLFFMRDLLLGDLQFFISKFYSMSCTTGRAGGLNCEPLKAVENLEPPKGDDLFE